MFYWLPFSFSRVPLLSSYCPSLALNYSRRCRCLLHWTVVSYISHLSPHPTWNACKTPLYIHIILCRPGAPFLHIPPSITHSQLVIILNCTRYPSIRNAQTCTLYRACLLVIHECDIHLRQLGIEYISCIRVRYYV